MKGFRHIDVECCDNCKHCYHGYEGETDCDHPTNTKAREILNEYYYSNEYDPNSKKAKKLERAVLSYNDRLSVCDDWEAE